MTTYEQFVESKVDFQNTYGFDTTDADLNPILKPHQKLDRVKDLAEGWRYRGEHGDGWREGRL